MATEHAREVSPANHEPSVPGVPPIKSVLLDGTETWRLKGRRLHRLDGPARIYPNGKQEWYVNGKRHRMHGPACVHPDGSRQWWVNGNLHRLDGPAVINADGLKQWCLMGRRHRVGGPAVIHPIGEQYWYHIGERHRFDGPALIHADGSEEWYIRDKPVNGADVTELYAKYNAKAYADLTPEQQIELVLLVS